LKGYQGHNYFKQQSTVITDLVQNHLGKRHLLDAISSIDHCWECALCVLAELFRHNDVGDHCCGGLLIVPVGIINSELCNQPRDKDGVEG
jgi:hypothetical protein